MKKICVSVKAIRWFEENPLKKQYPIMVFVGTEMNHGDEVKINGPSRIIFSPDHRDPVMGTRVWVETQAPVTVMRDNTVFKEI